MDPSVSAHLDSVISLSGETDLCQACVKQRGLCGRHRRGILPQLAQPFWYRLVGRLLDRTTHEQMLAELSPEARRIYNRKRTKAARRATADRARLAALASIVT